jgi:CDP-diacylglycerol--serine O-phosphatidyltransferase
MKQRHFSMLRDFQLADWFTLGNAFCGTGAVFAAMRFLLEAMCPTCCGGWR